MVAILDVDGTLVDTNYHHTLAWFRAFRQLGHDLPVWRIHRHIGMGGDQLVGALCGEEIEARDGEEIRACEAPLYMAMIDEIRPIEAARDLLVWFKEHDATVVLASSAKEEEVERYIDLIDARELADAWTTSADVEETKPEPDLIHSALDAVDGSPDDALMVGDSTWDCEAAKRAGVRTVALRTGGFAADELTEAGAEAVFESIPALIDHLEREGTMGS